jgi:DNA-binding transcriptional MerR regulator
MSTPSGTPFGIEELAARIGVDAGMIRCYEELGLLPKGKAAAPDAPLVFDEADVEAATAIVRVTNVIGLPVESARGMAEAEQSLARLRERLERSEDPERRAELATDALSQVEQQLDLTRARRRQLDGFEAKLWEKRNRLKRFLTRHPEGAMGGGAQR